MKSTARPNSTAAADLNGNVLGGEKKKTERESDREKKKEIEKAQRESDRKEKKGGKKRKERKREGWGSWRKKEEEKKRKRGETKKMK